MMRSYGANGRTTDTSCGYVNAVARLLVSSSSTTPNLKSSGASNVYIKRSVFQENNSSGDWLVKGYIAIDGEFTRHEWEAIREAFMAMGLFQVSTKAIPLSQRIPSRSECVAAVQDVASGRDPRAWEKIVEKYKLPEGSKFNISTGQFIIPPHLREKP